MMVKKHGNVGSWRKNDYWTLAAFFILATILTWGIHEFAHWLTGRILGYDMWITFNQVGLVQGEYSSVWHQSLVAMAGPIVTWLQAVVVLLFIRQSGKLWPYSFLFLAFWMRTVAMLISFLSNPNDEAKVSLLLGLPMWVLPAISVIFLLVLTVMGSRALKVGWKGNLVSYVMASLMTAVVVFSDQLLFFSN
ncbi:hypothetical protein [Candidatus Leptofilum sp.]|uniref:hypothetical protein n=1 Tax=Candidatus Leptofilum sp. TaxID=3241576 RepID=UPI003B5B0A30